MATRSIITAKRADGTFKAIYVHYDGYPSYVGAMLLNNYSQQDKIEALLDLGDLSALYESTDCPEGHSYSNQVRGYCVAYGRDRGEEDAEGVSGPTLESVKRDMGQDYEYLWDGEKWFCDGEPLTQQMIDGEE